MRIVCAAVVDSVQMRECHSADEPTSGNKLIPNQRQMTHVRRSHVLNGDRSGQQTLLTVQKATVECTRRREHGIACSTPFTQSHLLCSIMTAYSYMLAETVMHRPVNAIMLVDSRDVSVTGRQCENMNTFNPGKWWARYASLDRPFAGAGKWMCVVECERERLGTESVEQREEKRIRRRSCKRCFCIRTTVVQTLKRRCQPQSSKACL